jgi:hypothetical protein
MMIAEYFETRFRTEAPFESWPDEFAIITAYATTGHVWSPDRNMEADIRLQGRLLESSLQIRRLTGYSPKSGHAEPGWALVTNVEEAVQIGREFLQDAIYFVWSDDLFVIRCSDPTDMFFVDRFSARLDENLG